MNLGRSVKIKYFLIRFILFSKLKAVFARVFSRTTLFSYNFVCVVYVQKTVIRTCAILMAVRKLSGRFTTP